MDLLYVTEDPSQRKDVSPKRYGHMICWMNLKYRLKELIMRQQ